MTTTRNGWDVYTSYSDPHLVNFPWVTGKVRKGDHYTVLDYVARRLNNEVEKFDVSASWGFNPRPVRGYTNVWSEHASGTCFDWNANRHPIRVKASKTLSRAKIKRIRKIVKDTRGAVRWGGEWKRPDAMHFELVGGNAKVSAVAKLIRAGKLPGSVGGSTVKPVGKPKPKPSKRVKANSGNSKSDNIAIANLLNGLGYAAGVADGVPGTYLRAGVKRYQKAQTYFPGMKRDGDWGSMTQDHFDWTRKVLQPNLNKWKAVQRRGLLAHDGDLAKLTKARVKAVQTDNYPKYKKVGGYYKDGEPGPITCKMLGIKKHPSA